MHLVQDQLRKRIAQRGERKSWKGGYEMKYWMSRREEGTPMNWMKVDETTSMQGDERMMMQDDWTTDGMDGAGWGWRFVKTTCPPAAPSRPPQSGCPPSRCSVRT